MSEKQILAPHIAVQEGVRGGRPFIDGTGIAVHHIAVCNRLGLSVDDIIDEYELSPAEIHAALAYYFDHRDEIDGWLADDEGFFAEMKRVNPSLIEQKLKALRA